jgi:hypothetical protein
MKDKSNTPSQDAWLNHRISKIIGELSQGTEVPLSVRKSIKEKIIEEFENE